MLHVYLGHVTKMIPGWVDFDVDSDPLDTLLPIPYISTYGGGATLFGDFSGVRESVNLIVGNFIVVITSGFNSGNNEFGFIVQLVRYGVHGMLIVDELTIQTELRLSSEGCPDILPMVNNSCIDNIITMDDQLIYDPVLIAEGA